MLLDLAGIGANAVLHCLDCVFATIKPVATAPDLTKCTTSKEL